MPALASSHVECSILSETKSRTFVLTAYLNRWLKEKKIPLWLPPKYSKSTNLSQVSLVLYYRDMNAIDQVISDLLSQREAIDRAVEALRSVQGVEGSVRQAAKFAGAATTKRGGRRTMSAEGRKRIAEAQRKRWAATKKTGGPKAATKKHGGKRGITAAGRKRLAEAMRQRWAAKRAGKSGKAA
jgi:hypothetical protein